MFFFPKARVLRMDLDTMSGKDAHINAYSAFLNGEADILLGTQIIAKGLDFENVRLTGSVLADASLNFPDFRSAERTFQILTQISGRAGRREQGIAVIQTYTVRIITPSNAQQTRITRIFTIGRSPIGEPPCCRLSMILSAYALRAACRKTRIPPAKTILKQHLKRLSRCKVISTYSTAEKRAYLKLKHTTVIR